MLVHENSSASHYNDACKPVSVCELPRIENNGSLGPAYRPSARRANPTRYTAGLAARNGRRRDRSTTGSRSAFGETAARQRRQRFAPRAQTRRIRAAPRGLEARKRVSRGNEEALPLPQPHQRAADKSDTVDVAPRRWPASLGRVAWPRATSGTNTKTSSRTARTRRAASAQRRRPRATPAARLGFHRPSRRRVDSLHQVFADT